MNDSEMATIWNSRDYDYDFAVVFVVIADFHLKWFPLRKTSNGSSVYELLRNKNK